MTPLKKWLDESGISMAQAARLSGYKYKTVWAHCTMQRLPERARRIYVRTLMTPTHNPCPPTDSSPAFVPKKPVNVPLSLFVFVLLAGVSLGAFYLR